MSWLNAIARDFAERRLWPVVGLLVAGIVALPLVISHTVVAPPAVARPAPPNESALFTPAMRQLVSASLPTAGAIRADVHLHDPFLIPKPTATTSTTAAAAGAKGPRTAASTTTSSTKSTTTTKTTTTTTTTTTHRSLPAGTVYAITLNFGQAAGVRRVSSPLRLSVFPSSQDPQIAYLGVREGGRSVLFLVSKGAIASGDGSCLPRASNCQVVALRPGETEFFDVTSPSVGLVQYELDLVGITARHPQTRKAAIDTNRLVSAAGLAFIRSVNAPYLDRLAFDLVNGMIVTGSPPGKGGVTPGQGNLRAVGPAPPGGGASRSAPQSGVSREPLPAGRAGAVPIA